MSGFFWELRKGQIKVCIWKRLEKFLCALAQIAVASDRLSKHEGKVLCSLQRLHPKREYTINIETRPTREQKALHKLEKETFLSLWEERHSSPNWIGYRVAVFRVTLSKAPDAKANKVAGLLFPTEDSLIERFSFIILLLLILLQWCSNFLFCHLFRPISVLFESQRCLGLN